MASGDDDDDDDDDDDAMMTTTTMAMMWIIVTMAMTCDRHVIEDVVRMMVVAIGRCCR